MTSNGFEALYDVTARSFLNEKYHEREISKVPSQSWQSQDISDRPGMGYSLERPNYICHVPIPKTIEEQQELIKPNLPWAEDHFLERVSGIPYNPPPSAAYWPYTRADHKDHTDEIGKFSHTYPERFWPREANLARADNPLTTASGGWGIRYKMGDLDDVVQLLTKDPYTRQAYLPVWFPEDTGAAHGQRVPCTLGYHFLYRDGRLNITYLIRSCDFMRHFRDDMYLAMRLCLWMAETVFGDGSIVDRICFHAMSMHIFEGDIPILKAKYGKD